MKTRLFIIAAITAAFAVAAKAQTPARTNIEHQPDWGPVGYELAEF